jgi:hypothetical protein
VTEHQGVPARPPNASPRWRKGTRAVRLRTARRATGANGQPQAPVTGHGARPQDLPKGLTCAECFGPRSAYRQGLFCARCERALFGDEFNGYQRFIRSERQHQTAVRQRLRKAGLL